MRSSPSLKNQERAKKVTSSDPWEAELFDFLLQCQVGDFVTGGQLLMRLSEPIDEPEMRHYRRIGKIMKRLGWEKGRRRQPDFPNPVDGYIKPETEAITKKEAIAISCQNPSASKNGRPLKNPWTSKSKIRHGIVYFIGGKDIGPVKIGFTSDDDPKRRLGQLQVGSHEELEVLGWVNGTIETERKIHSFLHYHKVRGEWFHRKAALSVLNHLLPKDIMRPPSPFVEQLGDAAFTIEDIDKDDDLEEESLAITVARHVILDLASRFESSNAERPLPLRAWLTCQIDRDDPVGDLANDCKGDSSFPELGSLPDYLTWITGVTSNDAVTKTVIDAWIECQQVICKLNAVPMPSARKQRQATPQPVAAVLR
jgi:hypothetical protein